MGEMMAEMQQWLDDILSNLTASHEEVMGELGGAWSNSTLGGYEFSWEGLQNATSAASSQAYDEAHRFYLAVDWSERWIQAMLSFHILMWSIWFVATVRGCSSEFKITFFIICAILCGSASMLNTLGGEHWEKFSSENYFDSHGIFLAITWCTPFVVLLLFLLLQMLFDVAKLLVNVKVEQLKRRKMKEAKDAKKKKN
eukprot:TRINITY_DN14502_c0_g1_i1.p1 TRINITY_DN14502_c0_g1~~TRINITY_DN14502_c0_g1_i1.p1  ORF type:complete len:213 (+),score=35.01 TRINITY_DN14502_c0_g1_i1:48-641(+)